ncbi:TetR/AcrR family transcriptional regulator [Marmoricola sp. OAE513]|uniref:TetR/AcrR family transcriptional regulator n=1 Tax=Marmoricola sp. OAE513 TaxID=2817894 RepID=UPI001AE45B46
MTDMRRPYGGVSAEDRTAKRRAALLDAGLVVIGRDGVGSCSIEAVCAQAELGKRYFYESFTDRDAFLLELVDRLFADIRSRMGEDLAEFSDRAERSRAVVRTLVEVLSGDQRRARLYAESAGHPVLARRRAQAITEYTEFVADHVLPVSDLPAVERHLATRILVSGTTDLVTSWLSGEVQATKDEIVQAIIAIGLSTS